MSGVGLKAKTSKGGGAPPLSSAPEGPRRTPPNGGHPRNASNEISNRNDDEKSESFLNFGWIATDFGNLFQFIRNGLAIKQDKSGKGLPVTRIETIWNAEVDPNRVGYANLEEKDCHSWLLEPGDILFSHINSVSHIGKCAVFRGQPDKLVHGMNLLCLRCDPNKVDPEFAKYLIRSDEFRSRLSNYVKKAVNQASVSIRDIQAIRVFVPALPEQRRIAKVLDRVEGLRAKRLLTIEALTQLQESIFTHLFGDPYSNPKKWPLKKLGELISGVTNGLTRRNKESHPGNDIVFRLRDIRDNSIDFIDLNRITLTDSEKKRFEVRVGDLLFIRVNGNPDYVGRCAIFQGYPESVFFNDHIMRVDLNREVLNGGYISFLLNGSFGKKQIALHRKTSAGQHTINQDGISKIDVPLPPISLQNEFEHSISSIEVLKDSFQKSRLQFDTLFASLQHRAFRGEL